MVGAEGCTNGHHFKSFAAPQAFSCVHCERKVPTGAYFFACMECDRDLCPQCYECPASRDFDLKRSAASSSKDAQQTCAEGGFISISMATMTTKAQADVCGTPSASSAKGCAPKPRSRMATKGISVSSLEVFGPIAPAPPPQLLAGITQFTIPDTETLSSSFCEDDCCQDGAHVFQRFPASRSLPCARCHASITSGRYVHSCDECDTDLCGACYQTEKSSTKANRNFAPVREAASVLAKGSMDFTELLGSMKVAWCPGGEGYEAEQPQLSKAGSKGSVSSTSTTSTATPQSSADAGSPLSRMASIDSLSTISSSSSSSVPLQTLALRKGSAQLPLARLGARETISTTSSRSGKECKLCKMPYSGFGLTCGDCRKTSGLGVRQCRQCQHCYFSGFGDVCEDCQPSSPTSSIGTDSRPLAAW